MRSYARLGALVATSALTLSGLVTATAPSAQALMTPDPSAGQAAAGWLAGELATNGLFNGTCSYDCGNDIDAGTSLIAIGGHASTVSAMKTNLPTHVNGYISGDSFGDANSTYAGSVAKSLVFAQVSGLNPASYGGVNLVTRLEAQVRSTGADAGSLFDTSTFGDYANTLGQAFATRGLATAGSGKAGAVRDFLLSQQCPSGFFRLSLASPPSCSAAGAANIDATSTVVTQLSAMTSTPAITDAIDKAKTWLATAQNCDGSFGSGDDGENANSTGLAATALGASVAAQEAARWLNRHQARGTDVAANTDPGAIALNDADYAAGKRDAITSASRGRWQRATAQAATGLASFSSDAAPQIHLSTVEGFRKAGTTISFRVTGAEAGTVVCLGSSRALTSATGAILTGKLPAGTGKRAITATDGYGDTASSIVSVLGARTLTVHKSKNRVKRKKFVTVTVSGLQPGENASIRLRNVVKATGTASPSGTFVRAFRVGTKRGKATITAYGQYGDIRRGATKITVVK